MPKSFMGLRFHRGEPEFPSKLRSYRNSLLTKSTVEPREGINNYTDHQIDRWYGVSFRLRWFAGIWIFGGTTDAHERGPVPSARLGTSFPGNETFDDEPGRA